MIYIISTRYSFAELWCKEHDKNPHGKDIRIITTGEQCRGVQLTDDDEIVKIGSADVPFGSGTSLYREWNFVEYLFEQTKKTR